MAFKDLTGNKYNRSTRCTTEGRLTVLNLDSIRYGTQRFYKCLCDCGNETVVNGSRLSNNRTVSCGCYRKEVVSALKRDNLEGQRFGRLVVQNLDKVIDKSCYWHCICDCGNTKSTLGYNIKSGSTQSCGCIQKEIARESAKSLNTTHGMTDTKVWECWSSMIARCNRLSHHAYPDYAGRGITVCSEWLEFTNFYRDIGNPPTDDHSIDRIDNNKGYYLENCRWATTREQGNNRRNNHLLEIRGRTQTIGEWAHELDINYQTLYYRVKHNLDPLTRQRIEAYE